MNKARAVFRSFFNNEKDYADFLLANSVSATSDSDSDGETECWRIEVRDENGDLFSKSGKPAKILVNSQNSALMIFWIDGKLHRQGGPAYVDMDSNSIVVLEWWERGVRLKRELLELVELAGEDLEEKLAAAFACIGLHPCIKAMLDAL